MMQDEDWLFRPVLRGMLKAESLIDPNVSLAFIALCNEALDVQDENLTRYNRAQEAKLRQQARR